MPFVIILFGVAIQQSPKKGSKNLERVKNDHLSHFILFSFSRLCCLLHFKKKNMLDYQNVQLTLLDTQGADITYVVSFLETG
jgi:hypothetical protein